MTNPKFTTVTMPEPTDIIEGPDGALMAAMFLYLGEGHRLPESRHGKQESVLGWMAHSHGYAVNIVSMDDDIFGGSENDESLLDAYESGENVLPRWDPSCPAGHILGGKWDTEDGPIAVFLKKIDATSQGN